MYSINWKRDVVNCRFFNHLSDQAAFDSIQETVDSKHFPNVKGQLIDLLDVNNISVTHDGIIKMAEIDTALSKIRPHVKLAGVTTSRAIHGIIRQYQAYSVDSNWYTRIFDDINDANDWLNDDEDYSGCLV